MAVFEALRLVDDSNLYDEEGNEPYLDIPSGADDYAVRLPWPKVRMLKPLGAASAR